MSYLLVCDDPIQLVGGIQGGRTLLFSLPDGTTPAAALPYCSSGFKQVAYVPPFDSTQLDPTVCTELFGAGFLLFLTPWAVSWGLRQILKPLLGR